MTWLTARGSSRGQHSCRAAALVHWLCNGARNVVSAATTAAFPRFFCKQLLVYRHTRTRRKAACRGVSLSLSWRVMIPMRKQANRRCKWLVCYQAAPVHLQDQRRFLGAVRSSRTWTSSERPRAGTGLLRRQRASYGGHTGQPDHEAQFLMVRRLVS